MILQARPMARVLQPDTPIGDMLDAITNGEACATFHGQPGGEWDTLRSTPLRVRRSLTTAGFFRYHGWQPDKFCDMLIEHGRGTVNNDDPIAWYLRTARLALTERRYAHRCGLEAAISRTSGCVTYFQYRDMLARQQGHESYHKMRTARGWQ